MRRDRIGPLCRGSGRRTSPSCAPPFTPSVTLYAREGQAVVCPLLRGRSPTRSVAPKQPRPPVHPFCHPLRARGSGRGLPAATGSLANAIGRAKTAEAPRSPLLSPSTRARARPWSARCYGVARQRDRSRQNSRGPLTPSVTLYAREGQAVVCPLLRGRSPTRSVAPKQPRASGVLSLRHFGLARGCRRIWRGE